MPVPFNPANHRNLGNYTEAGLRELHKEATQAYNATFAIANADNRANLTQEHLDQLRALRDFRGNVEVQLATFAADTTDLDKVTDEDTTPPSVADVAKGQQQDAPPADTPRRSYLVASAGSSGFESGQKLTLADAAAVFQENLIGLMGVEGTGKSPVFALQRAVDPELMLFKDSRDKETLARAADQSRLPGGSLMATFEGSKSLTSSGGWCAVSQPDYAVRSSYGRDGILSLPTVGAPRGGLRWYPELLFSTVFGGHTGANFFNLTETQVEAGVAKTFVEVGCPTSTELRLHAAGLGVVTNLLALRGLPEYTEEFISGAMLGFEYYQNMLNIQAIVAGSTAVDISATNPWASDGSVFSVVLPAADMAATDIRASKMLSLDATIEMVFPVWLLPQIRADLARREGMTDPFVADQWIISQFAKINVVAYFVRNYQDAWCGADAGLGATARQLFLPITLKFLAYPAGTWVRAEQDVIRISNVYDSVRLAGNQKIEMFMETGWRMIPRLTGSYEYEVDICPNGKVGEHHSIACPTG